MTKETNTDAWRSLTAAYRSQRPGAVDDNLELKLRDGVALFADLRLDAALKLVGGLPEFSTKSLVRTDFLQALIDALCELSSQDALTGLWNRRYFDHRFEQELRRAQRDGRSCAIALIDVDHFKRINDAFGHSEGDQVLQSLAALMQAQLRTTDEITSRFGGEEFAVILPGTHALGAKLALERLRQQVERHCFNPKEPSLTVTVSAGIAAYNAAQGAADPEQLFKQADSALYEAKQRGRNRVCISEASADEQDSAVTANEKEALLR